MNRDSAIESLKQVESEFEASRFALARAMTLAQRDPTILHGQPLTAEDLRRAHARSEVTFIVRLFAQFEGTVRDYWAAWRATVARNAATP